MSGGHSLRLVISPHSIVSSASSSFFRATAQSATSKASETNCSADCQKLSRYQHHRPVEISEVLDLLSQVGYMVPIQVRAHSSGHFGTKTLRFWQKVPQWPGSLMQPPATRTTPPYLYIAESNRGPVPLEIWGVPSYAPGGLYDKGLHVLPY